MKFTRSKVLLGLTALFVIAAVSLIVFDYFQSPQRNANVPAGFRGARNFSFNNTLSEEQFSAAVAACAGKSFNDSCVLQTPRGALNASCQLFNETLACRPVFSGNRTAMGNFSDRR